MIYMYFIHVVGYGAITMKSTNKISAEIFTELMSLVGGKKKGKGKKRGKKKKVKESTYKILITVYQFYRSRTSLITLIN